MKLEVYILINRYKKILDERLAKAKAEFTPEKRKLAKSRCCDMSKPHYGYRKIFKTVSKKKAILRFFTVHGRWPKRTSSDQYECKLGTSFENYLSKKSGNYDRAFRRVAMASGRVSNHKRPHDPAQFKQDILDFLAKNGRVPLTSYSIDRVEARLRNKLDYYTKKKHDMSLLGKIYEVDKCHLSGIPTRFRKFLNGQLDVEKPLIRLVK